MKKIILFHFILFPLLGFTQTECIVNEIKHSFNGTKIYDHRTEGEVGYLETTNDSIIYHKASWWTGERAPNGMSYVRTSLSIKGAKKMKSFEIKTFGTAKKYYLLSIILKPKIMVVKGFFDGVPAFVNYKKTFLDMLFDSKEEANKFVDDYFKKK